MINTRFWIDDYISNLDPIEKLLFLYCLTNPYTDISGVYEIPLKHIALETGLDREMVIKIMNRFERDNKIIYQNGWIGIKNFAKHQQKNPKVTIGIENGLKQAPKYITDRLSIDYDTLSHLNSNINTNIKRKSSPPKSIKKSYGELESVKLTDEEHSKLSNFLGENNLNILIFEMDMWIQSSGKNYKNHYAALLKWAKRKGDESNQKKQSNKNNIAFI